MASPGPRESDDRRGGNYNNRDRDTRRDFPRDSRGGRDYNSSRGGRRDDHRGDRPDRSDNRHSARSRSPTRNDRRHNNDRPRSPRPNNPRDHDRTRRGSDERRPPPARGAGGAGGGNGASVPSSRAPHPSSTLRGREIKPSADMDVDDADDDDEEVDEEAAMKKIMGFAGFRSTKNTKVPGNDRLYGVRKDKQTQYRQYMNRVGGFNRPLSPSRM